MTKKAEKKETIVYTEKELNLLIDKGAELNETYKTAEKELKSIKSQLKEYAKSNNTLELTSNENRVVFTSTNSNVIDYKKVFKLITFKKFVSLVKINMKDLKEELSKDDFNKVNTVLPVPYAKVSFK